MGQGINKEIDNPKGNSNKKLLQRINNASTIDDIKIILKKIVKSDDQ